MAGYPIIGIDSFEEDQVVHSLAAMAKSAFQADRPPILWDLESGISGGETPFGSLKEPAAALAAIQKSAEPGFFVFRDLQHFFSNPEVLRGLKNVAQTFRGQNRFLFLLGSEMVLPPELRKDVHLVEFGLPDFAELQEIVAKAIAAALKRGAENRLTPDQTGRVTVTLQGFTTAEAHASLTKALWTAKTIDESLVSALQSEKEQLARKEGILEYVRGTENLEGVGGLQNLKNWLVKRKGLFTPEAAAAGINPPRGLLMMGISGCGKSLSVKAISSLWGLPLFRLDMNQVYSGLHGSPEATFHRAIRSIESVAPAILWIDEIEGGISSSTMKDGSTGAHIFSAFLTWMQEKSAQVFVAATANRIDLLPAEIIRKGRFDQVFFIDLPSDKEREEIFRVHLRKRKADLALFDLSFLSVATEFWNGAEIEHVVEAAMVEAFYRGAALAQDDLYTIIRGTVPLSRTMSEQIKFIKTWAAERAVSASQSEKAS